MFEPRLHHLCILLLALAACTPKAPEPEIPAAVPLAFPVVEAPRSAPQASPQNSTRPAPTARPTPPVAVARPFDESLLRGREFLLSAAGPTISLVRDPDLGALGADLEVFQAVEDLVNDAADGVLDNARLVPRWSLYLQAWAARFKTKASKWDAIRVGQAREKEGEGLMVPVKLSSSTSTSFWGWLVLSREGKGFLVSDVQLVESVPRTDPFDPETSGQLISSPSLR